MVSLKLKLLSSLLYLLSSVYIFIKFVNSLPKPWLNKTGCTNEIGCTNGIGCIGCIGYKVSEVKVGVSIVVREVEFLVILVLVLALAKLFLKR
jgi:hypothetical protein